MCKKDYIYMFAQGSSLAIPLFSPPPLSLPPSPPPLALSLSDALSPLSLHLSLSPALPSVHHVTQVTALGRPPRS